MEIKDFCTTDVVSVTPDTGVGAMALLMREQNVGALVVIEKEGESGRKPVGVVTDRDLVIEVIAANVPLDSVTAADIMSEPLTTVRACENVYDVIQRAAISGVRRMPVLDENGDLIGLASLDDLVEIVAEELSTLVRAIVKEHQLENRRRPSLTQ